ncbi:MAG TPA: hypothetical protein VFC23_12235 [Thermoanaerobaculia bacterium]|nr:hypothetical protein [Thermoanaerobaculia bacterium]
MDIVNDTDTNTKYTVKNSSGSGMGPHPFPFRPEDTDKWEVLAPGATVHHTPASKGPWKVYFFVNGRGFAAEASSDNDRVNLVATPDAFKTEVRRVSHARAS